MYEWMPSQCEYYHEFGHVAQECRRKKSKKIWIPKIPQTHAENIIAPVNDITIATETTVDNTVNTVATQQQNSEEDVDQEGFQRALKPSRVRTSNVSLINTENHFQALDRSEGQNTGGIVVQQEQ